ncbi:uncharacterized protein MYCFIDRAFT_195106 [Pseudocercospora fijiensis CIRAD86]|uniref:Deoxyribonuclease NucA/NucB domain-containing protein n=1 Tax=Pseudocercospora fijiensis (strain CIRAD86) TaxID=383855 RepID=M2Z256_PSEFD|nr:uncharacterized protein MYCFIDRAFT_195106 [Pseudocercospora fijiensis CIRAD86]EME83905.1 hypothetical protein MYCFIDRAFT_195106 [Pseudocercospora fijiensis CIRAD86]
MITLTPLLALGLAYACTTGATVVPRDTTNLGSHDIQHDRIIKRSDRGRWTMFCGGTPPTQGSQTRGRSIEEACNNACYYMNFVKPDFVATYDSNTDNNKNRIHSGCRSRDGSVCNKMPFSQRWHDFLGDNYNCDEFPMASMKQDDWKAGTVRNSLRCIDANQNSAAGSQLSNFERGVGTGLAGRVGDGPLNDGDTYQIAFNYDGADTSKLGFCLDAPNPGTADIWNQFFLSSYGGQTTGGPIHFPYQPETDNRYASFANIDDDNDFEDILQCRLKILRTAGDSYEAWTYDNAGEQRGHASAQLTEDQQALQIPGSGYVKDTSIVRLGEMGTGRGSANLVYYGVGVLALCSQSRVTRTKPNSKQASYYALPQG